MSQKDIRKEIENDIQFVNTLVFKDCTIAHIKGKIRVYNLFTHESLELKQNQNEKYFLSESISA